MILTACAYPIKGLLFLCILGIIGVGAKEEVKIGDNVNAAAATKAGSSAGGGGGSGVSHSRPVAGGNDVFTSSFLVRFRRSVDNDFAHTVANKYGFENLGAVSVKFILFSYLLFQK